MSIFYTRLRAAIRAQGGMFNAHLHLDRAGTLDEQYLSHIDFRILDASYKSLHEKHSVISGIHDGRAYDAGDLSRRVNACLDEMVARTRCAPTRWSTARTTASGSRRSRRSRRSSASAPPRSR